MRHTSARDRLGSGLQASVSSRQVAVAHHPVISNCGRVGLPSRIATRWLRLAPGRHVNCG